MISYCNCIPLSMYCIVCTTTKKVIKDQKAYIYIYYMSEVNKDIA